MDTFDAILAGAGTVIGLLVLAFGCLGLYFEGSESTERGLGFAVLYVFLGVVLLIVSASAVAVGLGA